jgi:DNA-binding transcriptional LysR family regulator
LLEFNAFAALIGAAALFSSRRDGAMKSRVDALGQRMDLNLLVTFDAIYRSRNLTAAGRVLGLSQPAMSHALARLRSTFADPLFVRLPGGLQPTPLAQEIAPVLVQGLAVIRGSLERKDFDPSRSTRVFNIRMGDIAEVVHLPRVIGELHAIAPGVRVNSITLPESQLSEALGHGGADMAVGNYALGAGCREATLYEGDYACVVRAGHPAIKARLTLKQFKAAEHILVAPKGVSGQAQVMERVLGSRKVNARITVQVSNFYAVMALVNSTDLIATIPLRLAQSMQQLTGLKVLAPPIPLPKLKVSLYWHERFHRDPGNAWLRGVYIGLFKS